MNKAYLVALREFVENLRTKTFWIGILAFPIIIVLATVLGRFLNQAKDVRSYAVVDHSEGQWLSAEVGKRIAFGDFDEMLEEAKAKAEEIRELSPKEFRAQLESGLADLPESLRPMVEALGKLDDADLERLQNQEMPSGAALQSIAEATAQLQNDPEALQEAMQLYELSRGKYELVELSDDELGDDPEATLNEKLQEDELFAYFVIGEDPVAGDEDSRYVSNNVTDRALRNWYQRHAEDVVRERRIAKLKRTKDLTDEEAGLIRASFRFDSRKIDEETGETEEVTDTDTASQFAPVFFVYLLWISVFTAAQMLLTNTVEEKSNRIIEVLLSSVSPMQLMAGKIFGIAATGLTVVCSWVLCAWIGVKLLPVFIPNMPDIGLTQIIGDPRYLTSFVAYFLAGYFFFAALLVGIGSVCNSLKEAQNLQQPIVILLIVPLVAMVPVVNDPNGTLARVLTYIPPFTPFLMMNRAGGPPDAWEYLATSVLLLVSIAIAFWAAAKIFRIGILMTGKPPKITEILGWLRAPVGTVATTDEK